MATLGTVLLWVLYILLGLVGLVLALLLLALLLPARVGISWSPAGLRVWAGIPGIRVQLVPARPKKQRKSKKAPPKAKKTEQRQPQSEAGKAVPQSTAETAPPGGSGAQPGGQAATEQSAPAGAPQPIGRAKAAPGPKKARPAPKAQLAKPPMDVRTLLEGLPSLVNMAGEFLGRVLHSLRFKQLRIVVPITGGEPDVVARKVGRANAWFYAIAASLEPRLRLRWQDVAIFPDYNGTRQAELLLQATVCGQLLPIAIAALWLLAALKREKII